MFGFENLDRQGISETEQPADAYTDYIGGDGYDVITADECAISDPDIEDGLGEVDQTIKVCEYSEGTGGEARDQTTKQLSLVPEAMFDRTDTRVPTKDMARFILDGLTEGDILDLGRAAGYSPPTMSLTLQDLSTCLPYIARATDTTAQFHTRGTTVAHALRDGDLFGDHYLTTYPDSDSVPLPASMDLLYSADMEDDALAQRFFGQYGIDYEWANDPERKLLIIDTGFMGGVAYRIAHLLIKIFGSTPEHMRPKIEPRLFCSMNRTPQLMQITEDPGRISAGLPRLNQMIGIYNEAREDLLPTSWRLASTLQMMPRFHGHFVGLRANPDGSV
ncbi:MAG TPA: hypothetical protein VFM05_09580, partial [Candidatus Saccharimonadales bacterium]|nr:hypothetical protein [Candidatus Saccharimonadales bacterium]